MIKKIYFFFAIISFLHSDDFDTNKKNIEMIKSAVANEELVAKGIEEYLLDTYKMPVDINVLKTNKYLGTDFKIYVLDANNKQFKIKINFQKLYAGMSYAIQNYNSFIQDIYKDNHARYHTLYETTYGTLNVVFRDRFASYLYDMIFSQFGNGSKNRDLSCSSSISKKICICKANDCLGSGSDTWGMKDHLYFFKNNTKEKDALLFYFHKDNFESGPAVVNTNLLSDSMMTAYSKYLKDGITLFDSEGKEYVKTPDDGIKELGVSK